MDCGRVTVFNFALARDRSLPTSASGVHYREHTAIHCDAHLAVRSLPKLAHPNVERGSAQSHSDCVLTKYGRIRSLLVDDVSKTLFVK